MINRFAYHGPGTHSAMSIDEIANDPDNIEEMAEILLREFPEEHANLSPDDLNRVASEAIREQEESAMEAYFENQSAYGDD